MDLRPSKVETVVRCGFCHGDDGKLEGCAGCGTLLHAECAAEVGCVSLGCSRRGFRRLVQAPVFAVPRREVLFDTEEIESLLAELVKEMGMPRAGPDGNLVAYEIMNKRTGDDLRDGTLGSRGVKSGDVLLLTSTFVAG